MIITRNILSRWPEARRPAEAVFLRFLDGYRDTFTYHVFIDIRAEKN